MCLKLLHSLKTKTILFIWKYNGIIAHFKMKFYLIFYTFAA